MGNHTMGRGELFKDYFYQYQFSYVLFHKAADPGKKGLGNYIILLMTAMNQLLIIHSQHY